VVTFLIFILAILVIGTVAGVLIFLAYQGTLRSAKNYERGLKMVPMLIHLPPSSEDLEGGGRDERDVTEEIVSQAQVMYNIIASTALKGFKHRIYGQRHVSFEIVAREGLVYYYVVVPIVLIDVVRQAIAAAYPQARLEEVEEHTIFSKNGNITGTIGGEFTLKKDFVYPIATYQDTKRDASRALLNALSTAGREDGIGIQVLIRPAREGWIGSSLRAVERIKKNRATGKTAGGKFMPAKDLAGALWKAPSAEDHKEESNVDVQLTALEQQQIDVIEEKTRYPGYETLVRVVASSNTTARSQTMLKNVVAAFSLFDSPSNNGFQFIPTRDVDELVTAYIFRFFPQSITNSVLNSVELATIFHLPDQKNIPTAQVKRQLSKQVDGPTELMDEGFLLGYNEFRGIKKPIRLSSNDRRRHTYMIGQTGTGKSKFLENLAFQDMMDGKGFAFIDPHGDSAEALMGVIPKERVEDIIYFNPSDMDNPIGLNMFEFQTPDQKDFLVQEAINMLYGLYDPGHTGIVGPRLEHIFRNCALLLMSDPNGGTFIDIPKLLVDADFRNSKLKYVRDPQVLDFWTKEFPASQKSSEAGELISWVVSKFGPFISNDAMRNIIGQTKSGFDLRDIMDNKKILLVNLSKGKMGEMNSKLLGIIFVMKFQAAAMSRANIPEDQRQDFSLYVDEFQNFATESFESILSEARKYRLNLILANQFMTQLTDKIREAIIGNVGTVVSGRIGITDAEILVKKFAPVFDEEDLTKLPNYQGIASVMINNTPSAPFSIAFTPPMVNPNEKLAGAMKNLSATKYGRPRSVVEADITKRVSVAAPARPGIGQGLPGQNNVPKPGGQSSSFLDEWLAKRQRAGVSRPGVIKQPTMPPANRVQQAVPNPQYNAQPAMSSGMNQQTPVIPQPMNQAIQAPQYQQVSPQQQAQQVPQQMSYAQPVPAQQVFQPQANSITPLQNFPQQPALQSNIPASSPHDSLQQAPVAEAPSTSQTTSSDPSEVSIRLR